MLCSQCCKVRLFEMIFKHRVWLSTLKQNFCWKLMTLYIFSLLIFLLQGLKLERNQSFPLEEPTRRSDYWLLWRHLAAKTKLFRVFPNFFSFSLSWPHHLSACLLNILLCSVVSYVLLESTKVFASLPDQVRKILVVFFGEVIIGICEILAR